jgi:ribosomal protein S18 acetylase RimI-like enzyme
MTFPAVALHLPDPLILTRPVRLSDTDSLYADCWPDRSFSAIYNLVQRAVRSVTDGRGSGVVIPGENGKVLGYGQVLMWPSCAEISDVVVNEQFRSRGYGTAIIQTLVQRALKLGADEAEIGASVTNIRAIALYRRLGFEDSHTILLDLGKGKENVLFLRLHLHSLPTASPTNE